MSASNFLTFDTSKPGDDVAEKLNKLPRGRYRVTIQPARSREDILKDFDAAAVGAPVDPAFTGKSDDEIMEIVDAEIEAMCAGDRVAKGASR